MMIMMMIMIAMFMMLMTFILSFMLMMLMMLVMFMMLMMLIVSDYKYSPVNFLGVNICVLGSLIYTKVNLFFLQKFKVNLICLLSVFYKKSSQVTFSGKRQSVVPKVEKIQETV